MDVVVVEVDPHVVVLEAAEEADLLADLLPEDVIPEAHLEEKEAQHLSVVEVDQETEAPEAEVHEKDAVRELLLQRRLLRRLQEQHPQAHGPLEEEQMETVTTHREKIRQEDVVRLPEGLRCLPDVLPRGAHVRIKRAITADSTQPVDR